MVDWSTPQILFDELDREFGLTWTYAPKSGTRSVNRISHRTTTA